MVLFDADRSAEPPHKLGICCDSCWIVSCEVTRLAAEVPSSYLANSSSGVTLLKASAYCLANSG